MGYQPETESNLINYNPQLYEQSQVANDSLVTKLSETQQTFPPSRNLSTHLHKNSKPQLL